MKPHKWSDIKAERFNPEEVARIRKEAFRDLLEEIFEPCVKARG